MQLYNCSFCDPLYIRIFIKCSIVIFVIFTLKQLYYIPFVVTKTTTSARHTQVPSARTTFSCWTIWTSSTLDFSVNCIRRRSSEQWKETTSVLRWHRSERTKSYCQCSVASLLNSSNSSSMHFTNVDNNMSATSSLADQVCHLWCSIHSYNPFWM